MHHNHQRMSIAMIACAIAAPGALNAAVVSVNQFTGDVTETFDQHSTNMAVQSLPVFGGAGNLQVLSAGGSIKVEFSSLLMGHQVVPLNDMMGGQLGVAQWKFNQPITRFGGWFENNSGADDATVTFFDVNNAPIQTLTANIPFAEGWTWNGWESDVPIGRIMVTGNGLVNGFLWYENMQIDFADVPGPSAIPAMAIAMMIRGGSRRRCTARSS